MTHTITLIPGDGIGPEVMADVVMILDRAGLQVDWDTQAAGVLENALVLTGWFADFECD